MHFGFILYSFYTVTGKIASKYELFSFSFILFYALMIFILFLYALIWQQVLKYQQLSFASINKAVTVIWGMIWGKLFFNEEISFKRIIGVLFIISGIAVLALANKKEEHYE